MKLYLRISPLAVLKVAFSIAITVLFTVAIIFCFGAEISLTISQYQRYGRLDWTSLMIGFITIIMSLVLSVGIVQSWRWALNLPADRIGRLLLKHIK